MHRVNPFVFILAETQVLEANMWNMLTTMGAGNWVRPMDIENEGELLVEVAGRMCYKSFGTELNANLTKVRDGNRDYIGNVIKTKHGSIFEHACTTVAFLNVSRVFTHELVRHRAGAAISQESMRFVRLDDIPFVHVDMTEDFAELDKIKFPGASHTEHLKMAADFNSDFQEAVDRINSDVERTIGKFTKMLNDEKVPFSLKKRITSTLRRLAPNGHGTNIIYTNNHRGWRNIFEQRTALDNKGNVLADQEMHSVMISTGMQFKERYPHFYQDMELETHPDTGNNTLMLACSKI